MSPSTSVTAIQVETALFPPTVKPPASQKVHFLGGAGVRGLDIEGKFTKFTAIGVYLEDDAVKSLSAKWKGKSADELFDSVDFFRDIVTGDFEKFMRVTMILPLTGKQYSENLPNRELAKWKSLGIYTEAEGKAIEKFKEAFVNETFPPGSSILFTQFPDGRFAVSFSKDETVPEVERVMIENKLFSQVVLETMIGKDGVTPTGKKSMANRLSKLLQESLDDESEGKYAKQTSTVTQDFAESKQDF